VLRGGERWIDVAEPHRRAPGRAVAVRSLFGDVDALMDRIDANHIGAVTAIAARPRRVRGYGPVQEAAMVQYRADLGGLASLGSAEAMVSAA